MELDITSGSAADWLVVGWFTPDYRPLAKEFAASLSQRNAPYHIYPVEPFGSSFIERTRKKPEIVLQAMRDYPSKTIVLMDIDCIVSGDISPVTRLSGDVGVIMKVREEAHPRISIASSSRIMVFHPTPDAKRFAECWQDVCCNPAHAKCDDEMCLAWTYVLQSDVRQVHIPIEYSARGVGECRNQVIAHKSEQARRTKRGGISSIRRALKSIEKQLFRTGRSARWKDAHPDRHVVSGGKVT